MPRTFDNLRRLESAVGRDDLDFSGRLMALHALADRAAEMPAMLGGSTVDAFSGLLFDRRHRKETQILSLYRAAAEPLAGVIADRRAAGPVRRAAIEALFAAMDSACSPARRAAAEALGGLPLAVRGPAPVLSPGNDLPELGLKSVCRKAGVSSASPVFKKGRSRVFPVKGGRLLVVKTADTDAGAELLRKEAAWMSLLRGRSDVFCRRFDIPEPFRIQGEHLFVLRRAGSAAPLRAIAFFVDADYFRYPNETGVEPGAMVEMLERCAHLLGRLAAMGMVHTAPIPLFHNRAQAWRRQDRGVYEWPRAGRLDRWLASSRYPNMAASGLRDFEHVESIRRPGKRLFFHIGSHLLGLLLVGASFFRNRDPSRVGIDERGMPHDARDLFDPALLTEVIRRVASGYLAGFAGRRSDPRAGPDAPRLAERMIEEMGVDRQMEELFRVADQKRLTAAEFRRVLEEGGLSRDQIARAVQGKRDIALMTGPHLGGFNDRISIPELIEFVQRTAAACICERFRKEPEAQCSGLG